MLSPGQGLLRVEALALWHLVGRPPQDTHLDKTDSTFCAKFMIMKVPCILIGKQQLETQTKEGALMTKVLTRSPCQRLSQIFAGT